MNWEQIDSIFRHAKELRADEREAYLKEQCSHAPEELAHLRLLLREEAATETLHHRMDAACGSPAIRVGDVIGGRFQILRFLGRGGMGEVYQAADRELRGIVALKTLRPELVREARSLERFRREVQLARQVTHGNVCRIFDVGYHAGDGGDLVYLTMEFLDGVTLSQLLRQRGKLPVGEALPLVRQIADGLTALHEKEIIHRDFKPGNVMIVPAFGSVAPRAVIADFGLARALAPESDAEPESGPTQPGQIVGTLEYMAPELLLGKEATPAVDIYAFGLVMYEMVVGTKAFGASIGGAFEKAAQRVLSKPVPPSQYTSDLPVEWERTILQCLEAEPLRRPPSAAAVLEGITGARAVEKPRRKTPRWLPVSLACAAALLLACVLALTKGWPIGWGHTGRPQMQPIRRHIAVLGFSVMKTGDADRDADLEVFADGLMEGITGHLSQYEGADRKLLIVPSSVVRQQAARTVVEAKTKLGVDEVVQGNLQTQGDRVRLMLTVVDASDAARLRQIDSVIVEEKRSNALSLEDAAVERLANALSLRAVQGHAAEAKNLAPPVPGGYDYYLQARGYLQRSDKLPSIESAISLFQKVLEVDRASALAYAGLGEAYREKFNLTRDARWLDEALKKCEQARQLNPSLPDTHIAMGRIHLDQGQYDQAQRDFEAALESDNRNSVAYQGLASAYEGLKKFDEAETTYRKAIALRPEDWNGYKQLGLFYYRRRDLGKAIAQYQIVASLTPDNAQAYSNLGAFQILQHATADAEKSLHRALELDPNRMSTLTNLAKIYFDKKDYPEAIKLYQRAAHLNPKDFRTAGGLGIAYLRSGDKANAAEPLDSAVNLLKGEIRLNPKRAELYSYLAFYQSAQGVTSGVEDLVDKAVTLSSEDIDILIRGAETEAMLGNTRKEMAILQKLQAKGYPLQNLRDSVPLARALANMGITSVN